MPCLHELPHLTCGHICSATVLLFLFCSWTIGSHKFRLSNWLIKESTSLMTRITQPNDCVSHLSCVPNLRASLTLGSSGHSCIWEVYCIIIQHCAPGSSFVIFPLCMQYVHSATRMHTSQEEEYHRQPACPRHPPPRPRTPPQLPHRAECNSYSIHIVGIRGR